MTGSASAGDLGQRVGVVLAAARHATMSQPVAVSLAICCSVLLTSEVRVVVIDCTEIGLPLPTPTLPTWFCRVGRRGASAGGGQGGHAQADRRSWSSEATEGRWLIRLHRWAVGREHRGT